VAFARRAVDGRREGTGLAPLPSAAPPMPYWVHGQTLPRLNVEHGAETVTAERLPCRLAGWDETKRHGVLEPVESFAARARDLGKFLHLASLEHSFGLRVWTGVIVASGCPAWVDAAANPVAASVQRRLPIDVAVWAPVPGRSVIDRLALDRWRAGHKPGCAQKGFDLFDEVHGAPSWSAVSRLGAARLGVFARACWLRFLSTFNAAGLWPWRSSDWAVSSSS
jgi:hypothetical protein